MDPRTAIEAMDWNLSTFFPEFDGPEMRDFKSRLREETARASAEASALEGLNAHNMDEWERVFLAYEDLIKRYGHLAAYVECLASADARVERFQNEEAELSSLGAELSKLEVHLRRALKEAPARLVEAFSQRPGLEGCRWYVERLNRQARHTMEQRMEELAEDLGVDGIEAWGRLYGTLSGKLEFEMEYPDGRKETVPMSKRRSLMEHPDREIRRAAFEKGNEAWAAVEDAACAALNSIAGTRLTLYRYRGIGDFLEPALFQAAITPKTLEAMMEAIRSEIELPRSILRTKAATMGEEAVRWYDLAAPLPMQSTLALEWEDATRMVESAFREAYPALATFFARMVERRWIDWSPRPGKRPGGFCTGSMLNGESRVFMTYNKTLGDVLTLAHETGHAYHSHLLRNLRPYRSLYPMTLAETASTFAEALLERAILDDPSTDEVDKAILLDMELSHGAVYLLDITVRFEFERALYSERSRGTLSPSTLREMMTAKQREVFGDTLEPGGEDPYFWASKLHFYITEVTFYNFPYTFGYLLSRWIYAAFEREGAEFLPRYERFLELSGSAEAPEVARKALGVDLEDPAFWTEAIHTLEAPLERFRAMLPSLQLP